MRANFFCVNFIQKTLDENAVLRDNESHINYKNTHKRNEMKAEGNA